MIGKFTLVCTALIVLTAVASTGANPIIDSAGEMDFLGICLRNCAQCKKMYGSYFEGQVCADSCVKFKGKIIPGL